MRAVFFSNAFHILFQHPKEAQQNKEKKIEAFFSKVTLNTRDPTKNQSAFYSNGTALFYPIF
jgi:hypothetical protein